MYSRWEKTTDTADRLAYRWVGGDGDAPSVQTVGVRSSDHATAPTHPDCEWDLYLVRNGERVLDFAAVYGETAPGHDLPAPPAVPPTSNKAGAVKFLSWWCRTNPSPLGSLARITHIVDFDPGTLDVDKQTRQRPHDPDVQAASNTQPTR